MLALGLNMPALLRGAGSSTSIPSFSRDFAMVKTLNHGIGPDITFTRTGTATYFNSSGVLTTATANEPRFDHDPSTLASKGLLIEEGRTNSIRNSQAGGATVGTIGSGGAMPTNWTQSITPTGLASEIVSTGTINGFSYIDLKYSGTTTSSNNITIDCESATQVTASSGQTWISSIYFALINGSAPASSLSLTITGRLSGGGAVSGQSQVQNPLSSTLSTSLKRFETGSITFSDSTVARVSSRFGFSAIPTSTAVDFTLRIAAPQLEQGAFATSYIPTTSAAVARGADVASVTSASATLNSNEGTLFYEGSRYVVPTSNYGVDFLRLRGSGSSTITLQSGSTVPAQQRLLVIDSSNVTVVNCFFESATANTVYRLAGVYMVDDFIVYQNGVASASDTSGSGWASLDTIRIGYNGSGGQINGHIRKVAYYPKRLTNDRLKSLTA